VKEFVTRSASETEELGTKIGACLEQPSLILLRGDLGAGKTTFTRGLARGLDLEDTSLVRSPTYTLINHYCASTGTIYHVDLYRLDSLRDILSIGLEEILEQNGIVIVEWGEKLPFDCPKAHTVYIEVLKAENCRRIHLEGFPNCDEFF
jgi:tRNA threonylcarbamoyladenosine biosynthesis protein TsaE